MAEKADNSNWKENLLKSSLPLEQLVAEELEKKNFYIAGEYSYTRQNEHEIDTEFSIDLLSRKSNLVEASQYGDELNILIECKYTYPTTKWVFSPHLNRYFDSLNIYCLNHSRQCVLAHRLNIDFQVCTKGIGLYDKTFDPNVISHGLNQLRYGMPNLIYQQLNNMDNGYTKYEPRHICICLMLVTTANLYILKPGQKLDTYYAASVIEDVSEKADALIVTQVMSPLLFQYSEKLLQSYLESKGQFNRRKSLDSEQKESIRRILKSIFPRELRCIVVNIDALDNILKVVELASFSDKSNTIISL